MKDKETATKVLRRSPKRRRARVGRALSEAFDSMRRKKGAARSAARDVGRSRDRRAARAMRGETTPSVPGRSAGGGVRDRRARRGARSSGRCRRGFHIVRLVGKSEPHERTIAESDRARYGSPYFRQKIADVSGDLEAELRKEFPVSIDEQALAAIAVPRFLRRARWVGGDRCSGCPRVLRVLAVLRAPARSAPGGQCCEPPSEPLMLAPAKTRLRLAPSPKASPKARRDWTDELRGAVTVARRSRATLRISQKTNGAEPCGPRGRATHLDHAVLPVARRPPRSHLPHPPAVRAPARREQARSPAISSIRSAKRRMKSPPISSTRYPDRALLLVSDRCSVYCRSARVRAWSAPAAAPARSSTSAPAFAWLAAHPEIRDVIVSGGDPLVMSTDRVWCSSSRGFARSPA